MRVRIVCYEDVHTWILGKFALKLEQELKKLSVQVDIARVADPAADVNHHIIYLDYDGARSSIDTLMVTHIDADWKFRKLKTQLDGAAVGICMSADTMGSLQAAGLPGERLCYINPAHDGLISPRPLLVGITTRLYPDGRKREGLLLQLSRRIDPAAFCFMIMGEGWDDIVAELRGCGFGVDYRPGFDAEAYRLLIPTLDYFLYLGLDEGSMGFIDALAAGVPTIVTPQGYHLDAPGGLVHPFTTPQELFSVFQEIAAGRKLLIDAVADWNWRDYALKHLELWDYLICGRRPQSTRYRDGLASLEAGFAPTGAVARGKARMKFLASSVRSLLARRR